MSRQAENIHRTRTDRNNGFTFGNNRWTKNCSWLCSSLALFNCTQVNGSRFSPSHWTLIIICRSFRIFRSSRSCNKRQLWTVHWTVQGIRPWSPRLRVRHRREHHVRARVLLRRNWTEWVDIIKFKHIQQGPRKKKQMEYKRSFKIKTPVNRLYYLVSDASLYRVKSDIECVCYVDRRQKRRVWHPPEVFLEI